MDSLSQVLNPHTHMLPSRSCLWTGAISNVDLRIGAEVVARAGVTTGDMGRKTIGNDLDNAWIKFDSVKLSKDSLLNRYAPAFARREH